MGPTRLVEPKVSVDITFAVRDGRDYLLGSEISKHLRTLSLVEFSFYIGFPALQVAERKSHNFTPVMHVRHSLNMLNVCHPQLSTTLS